MTHELRPQIVAPTHTYLTRMVVAGVGCVLLGAVTMVMAYHPAPTVQEPVATITLTETVTVPMSVPVVVATDPPPAPSSKEIALLFKAAGATYVKLASIGDEKTSEVMPKHGKPVLSEDDYITSAVAPVEQAAMPMAYRALLGTEMIVDGTCRAKISGFAVVSRLNGYTGYAGVDEENWTATTAMEHGAKLLAAKLDNCAGGTYARAAALPAVVIPVTVEDKPLAAAAEAMLARSSEAKAAQTEWTEANQSGNWLRDEGTTRTTQVLRHPATGTTWVSVHYYYGGSCGLPNLSVWGLYRADADGKLTRVKSSLGEVISIERILDIDNDGELEIIGRPWLGTERMIQDRDGSMLETLDLPFYSCPC